MVLIPDPVTVCFRNAQHPGVECTAPLQQPHAKLLSKVWPVQTQCGVLLLAYNLQVSTLPNLP